jgi:hypothetical protein
MAYLRCPGCGTTYFDRNPLTVPHRCPRCAVSAGETVELVRMPDRGGAAQASVLGPNGEPERRVNG